MDENQFGVREIENSELRRDEVSRLTDTGVSASYVARQGPSVDQAPSGWRDGNLDRLRVLGAMDSPLLHMERADSRQLVRL